MIKYLLAIADFFPVRVFTIYADCSEEAVKIADKLALGSVYTIFEEGD